MFTMTMIFVEYRNQQVIIALSVTQQWISSWTSTPSITPTPTPTSTPTANIDATQEAFSNYRTKIAQTTAKWINSWTSTPTITWTPTTIPTDTATMHPSPTPTESPMPQQQFKIYHAAYDVDTNGDGEATNADNAIIRVLDLNNGSLVHLTNSVSDSFDPRLSPDGQYIAYTQYIEAEEASYVALLNLNTRDSWAVIRGLEPDWSPDGDDLVFRTNEGNSDIMLINPDGTDVRQITQADINQTNWFPRWAPNGKEVYFLTRRTDTTGDGVVVGCDHAQIYRYDFDTQIQTPITGLQYNLSGFDISPDETHLIAFQTWEDTPSADGRRCGWNDASAILLFDLTTGELLKAVLERHGYSRSPVFTSDGRSIIYAHALEDFTGDGLRTIADVRSIHMINLDSLEETIIFEGHYQLFDLNWLIAN